MMEMFLIEAQEYLTTYTGEVAKRIVDVKYLLQRHSVAGVVDFLGSYLKDKEIALKNMIAIDKSHRKVDDIVASMFRLHMAIKILEMGNNLEINNSKKEVNNIVRLKQRAGKSSAIRKRYCRRNRSSGIRQDKNYDGENRETGHGTRSAA